MAIDLPQCTKCGYRHAIPRFEQLQLGTEDPCNREPIALADAFAQLIDYLGPRAHEGT